MGFISDLATKGSGQLERTAYRGREIWNQIFPGREEDKRPKAEPPPVPGGSYGRSSLSTTNALKRLVEALRSNAPGGWSDDR